MLRVRCCCAARPMAMATVFCPACLPARVCCWPSAVRKCPSSPCRSQVWIWRSLKLVATCRVMPSSLPGLAAICIDRVKSSPPLCWRARPMERLWRRCPSRSISKNRVATLSAPPCGNLTPRIRAICNRSSIYRPTRPQASGAWSSVPTRPPSGPTPSMLFRSKSFCPSA